MPMNLLLLTSSLSGSIAEFISEHICHCKIKYRKEQEREGIHGRIETHTELCKEHHGIALTDVAQEVVVSQTHAFYLHQH